MALMNALPLLEEIKEAIKTLLEQGKEHTIYSNKMPTTLEDRYFLKDVLGKGDWFMFERVPHTKAVAFNTLVPGVWIELFFSERDPKEPILEMVRIDRSPLSFTMAPEDLRVGFEKFKNDAAQMRGLLKEDFVKELLTAYERLASKLLPATFSDPEGIENLTYYAVVEGELVLENESKKRRIYSTNYHGLWLEKDWEDRPLALHLADFPEFLKPSDGDLKRALELLEERKKIFLPKYQKRADIPLL